MYVKKKSMYDTMLNLSLLMQVMRIFFFHFYDTEVCFKDFEALWTNIQ